MCVTPTNAFVYPPLQLLVFPKYKGRQQSQLGAPLHNLSTERMGKQCCALHPQTRAPGVWWTPVCTQCQWAARAPGGSVPTLSPFHLPSPSQGPCSWAETSNPPNLAEVSKGLHNLRSKTKASLSSEQCKQEKNPYFQPKQAQNHPFKIHQKTNKNTKHEHNGGFQPPAVPVPTRCPPAEPGLGGAFPPTAQQKAASVELRVPPAASRHRGLGERDLPLGPPRDPRPTLGGGLAQPGQGRWGAERGGAGASPS